MKRFTRWAFMLYLGLFLISLFAWHATHAISETFWMFLAGYFWANFLRELWP